MKASPAFKIANDWNASGFDLMSAFSGTWIISDVYC